MKIEAPEQKKEGTGWPRRKFFFSDNCSSAHLVLKSLWTFFLDHYYGSYEHLIIANCAMVAPLEDFSHISVGIFEATFCCFT